MCSLFLHIFDSLFTDIKLNKQALPTENRTVSIFRCASKQTTHYPLDHSAHPNNVSKHVYNIFPEQLQTFQQLGVSKVHLSLPCSSGVQPAGYLHLLEQPQTYHQLQANLCPMDDPVCALL